MKLPHVSTSRHSTSLSLAETCSCLRPHRRWSYGTSKHSNMTGAQLAPIS